MLRVRIKAETDRNSWRRSFTITDKEDGSSRLDPRKGVDQGGFNSSATSSDNAFKRLLQGMRSRAPGTWTDDRYEQSRHFHGTAYVAIHRLCTMFSQAEFDVTERPPGVLDPNQEKPTKSKEGEALVKYLQAPNWRDSFGSWMYRITQQKWLTGSALDWDIPNVFGQPVEHYVIPTALAIPQSTMNPQFPEGFYRIQPTYPYGPFSSYPTPYSSVGAPIDARWITRFQFPHPLLWYDGWSPLTGLRLSIDALEMSERSQFYKMKASINPSGVLNFENVDGAEPLPEAEVERIRAEWENLFQGVDNHGRLIVMPPGGKLDEYGRAPLEMDYTDSWAQKSSFVLGGLGITKPAAGMIEDSSYSTLFATLKQVNVLTVQPECDDLASCITRQKASRFGPNLIVKIRAKRIDDHDIMFQKLKILIDAKAITYNQLFKELDMPATEEAWGEERIGEREAQMEQEAMAAEANGMSIGEPAKPSPFKPGQKEREPTQMKPANAEMEGADEDAERARENPGALGRGALGPRDKIHDRKGYQSATELRESRDRMNKTLKTLLSRSKNGKHHLNGHKR